MICGSCKESHNTVADVKGCYSEAAAIAAEIASELYAEAVMSWVCGGGSPEDAGRYAACIASGREWDGGISPEAFSGETCDHGLALELCCGPGHYPPDM